MVDAIGSSFLGQTKSSSGAETAKNLFENNAETYLSLFLTQLKNQDPLNTFEVKDMTQQLSQLNNSQQLIDVNKNLETLIAANTTSHAASIANFINKDVKYISETVYSDGVNPNELTYVLDKSYESVKIEIKDSNGKLVTSTKGESSQGTHSIFWDGTNSSGEPVIEGTYTIVVSGTNKSVVDSDIRTLVTGTVSGIDFTAAKEPVVTVGYGKAKQNIALKDIAAVNDFRNAISNGI